MKALIRAVVGVSLVLGLGWSSAFAWHLQDSYTKLVRWAGCNATVLTSDDFSAIGAFYVSSEHTLFVGTAPDVPAEVGLMVLLHETGHCLQDQAGQLEGRSLVDVELEADMLAADLACGMGLDGPRLLHDVFVWAKKTFGYDGDPWHGTLVERISQGERAPACMFQKRSQEAA